MLATCAADAQMNLVTSRTLGIAKSVLILVYMFMVTSV